MMMMMIMISIQHDASTGSIACCLPLWELPTACYGPEDVVRPFPVSPLESALFKRGHGHQSLSHVTAQIKPPDTPAQATPDSSGVTLQVNPDRPVPCPQYGPPLPVGGPVSCFPGKGVFTSLRKSLTPLMRVVLAGQSARLIDDGASELPPLPVSSRARPTACSATQMATRHG